MSVLNSIMKQKQLPNEIVIVDSSPNNHVKKYINQNKFIVPIVYHYEKKAYPGKARNIGANLSSSEFIAFLDCKTIPETNWLKTYSHLIETYNADVVFGVTRFTVSSFFQKVLRAATFGMIGHQTVPGTLINKKLFYDSGGFLEHVRMGEDIEWRERLLKNDIIIHEPQDSIVAYCGLPHNLQLTLKKYVRSAYHTARLNILSNVKDAYLTSVLILSAIILPKWNYLIEGWDSNPLFIPHITKIYLLALVSLFLTYQLVHYIFFRNISQTLFSRTIRIMVLVFITLAVYRWNAAIAGWMEDAILYIPHITKIYLSGLVLTSVLYRGLFLPLNRKVNVTFLLPFRWIQVGMLGLLLDLLKSPGYIIGAIYSLLGLRGMREGR